MKKTLALIAGCLLIFVLNGCAAAGGKSLTLPWIYAAAAVLSLLLLIACCFLVRGRKTYFILLFSSVLVVNIGYTLLSLSSCLEMALMANRIAYLGSVMLPITMLFIILDVTSTPRPKLLGPVLWVLAGIVFLITASPGILDIYYKEVSFEIREGVAVLNKVYGPLHRLYTVYLVGCFAAMVGVILRAMVKKTVDSLSHAVILAMAVLVNLGIWLIEQLSGINFEMLSVSYIISELFLLGANRVISENQRLRCLVGGVEAACRPAEGEESKPAACTEPVDMARMEFFIKGTEQLTPTERAVYEAYIARKTTAEVMEELHIKENTLKYHNRNLYGKLGVSSRRELLELYKHIDAVKARLDEE